MPPLDRARLRLVRGAVLSCAAATLVVLTYIFPMVIRSGVSDSQLFIADGQAEFDEWRTTGARSDGYPAGLRVYTPDEFSPVLADRLQGSLRALNPAAPPRQHAVRLWSIPAITLLFSLTYAAIAALRENACRYCGYTRETLRTYSPCPECGRRPRIW